LFTHKYGFPGGCGCSVDWKQNNFKCERDREEKSGERKSGKVRRKIEKRRFLKKTLNVAKNNHTLFFFTGKFSTFLSDFLSNLMKKAQK
jgi:hypothetical protein